jgi:hypothetical protein
VEGRGNYQLPAPPAHLADRIFSVARSLVHLDEERGKIPLSVGLRNDRMEMIMEFDRNGGGESLSLVFNP